MLYSNDRLAEVLPITALEAVRQSDRSFVLVGSGTNIQVFEDSDSTLEEPQVIYHSRIFDSQAIHGISSSGIRTHEGFIILDAVIHGGHALALVQLKITLGSNFGSLSDCELVRFSRTELSQWILVSKIGLREISREPFATVLTSHNVLLQSSVDQQLPHLNTVTISDKVSAFLYSADVFVTDDHNYIIASGTAFGEILTWICFYDKVSETWLTRPCKEFRGHLGSIFGLSISESFAKHGQIRRLLASSSDDRTIRLWDISEVDQTSGSSTTDASNVVNSGTSNTFLTSTNELAVAWAHDSRVWKVDIAVQTPAIASYCSIISIGEDGQVIHWEVDISEGLDQEKRLELKHVQRDRYHVGKNIWGYCKRDNDIFSGGADGQIIQRYRKDNSESADQYSQSFRDVVSAIQGDILLHKSPTFKSYRLTTNHRSQILATTDRGALLQGTLQDGSLGWWNLTQDAHEKPIILASRVAGRYAFYIQQSPMYLTAANLDNHKIYQICELPRASIARLDLLSSGVDATSFCLATTYHGDTDLVLTWFKIDEKVSEVSNSYLKVPETFVITSIHYDSRARFVICGSRAGAIALYTDVHSQNQHSEHAMCVRHVHGSDTVTSIQHLEHIAHEDGSMSAFYLTTGRDGHICVMAIVQPRSDTTTPAIRVVHRTEAFLGRHLEGAYLLPRPNHANDLILYGFHADNFVAWNETKQMYLMELPCGGAHREWNFSIRSTPNVPLEGNFVWTKGKTVNFCTRNLEEHSIIKSGGHGREIKALAVHQRPDRSWLIATGSEDTNIRLFDYDSSKLRNISVLTKHKAGLQDLVFSNDGSHLMSAAGMEELLAWRLQPVLVLNLGVVCVASLLSPDATADARLMALDMFTATDKNAMFSYCILAAFSNGKVKQIAYTETEDNASFTVLVQLDMGSICLTQSQFLRSPFIGEHELHPSHALIASTNGHISKLKMDPHLNHLSMHKIHQNNITSLSTHMLSHSTLIVTGGDDNALAFTLAQSNGIPEYRSTIIPNAHAAALTALAVHELSALRDEIKSFAVVTAGNDQRLSVWTVRVKEQSDSPKVSVDFVDTRHTNIADISEIAVLGVEYSGEICCMQVLVVGIGMEVLKVDVHTR